jgi:hypothetical protein
MEIISNRKSGGTPPMSMHNVGLVGGGVLQLERLRTDSSYCTLHLRKFHQICNQWILQLYSTVEEKTNNPCFGGGVPMKIPGMTF